MLVMYQVAKIRQTQTLPYKIPVLLVFRERLWRNSSGVTLNRGTKCKWGNLKSVTFDKKTRYISVSPRAAFCPQPMINLFLWNLIFGKSHYCVQIQQASEVTADLVQQNMMIC